MRTVNGVAQDGASSGGGSSGGASGQHQFEFFTVPPSGTQTFTLTIPTSLDRLTVWAISGARTLTDMDFEVQLNGITYNSPLNVTAAIAADIIYRSGGAATEDDLMPAVTAADVLAGIDPFVFSVLITNNGGSSEDVSIMAVAISLAE